MENGNFFDVLIKNFPSESVIVPFDSPITLTVTPKRGAFLLSVTIPEIEFWANEIPQKNNDKINKYIFIG